MKKRILLCLMCLLVAVGCLFIATACGSSCDHEWQEATCTAPKTCKICHDTSGSALGHAGGTATCAAKAVCTRCGESYGELGTHEISENVVAATCTTEGYSEKVCSNCSYREVTLVSATGHKYQSQSTPATCLTDGFTTYTCSVCGDVYSNITSRATGHVAKDKAVWALKSDELVPGSACLHEIVEETPCKNCDEKLTRTYTVHKANYLATIVTAANCTSDGEIRYACTCGDDSYTYTAPIPKNVNAHNWETVSSAVATHECSVCHAQKSEVAFNGTTAAISAADLNKDNVSIAMSDSKTLLKPDSALLETMGEGVELSVETLPVAELPNMSAELMAKIDTPVYNFGMSKDGAPVNFNGGKMVITVPYELQEGQDPSGITVWYIDETGKTTEIDAIYVEGNAVFEVSHFSFYTVVRLTAAERCAKLGNHDWQDAVYKATCTEDGYTVRHCRRCGEFQTVNGSKATGHNYRPTVVAPTCSEKGYTVYICANCNESYTSNYTEMVEHSYVEQTVAPTCTKEGYTLHTCSGCGKEYKDNHVAVAGHKYVDGVCSVCGIKQAASDVNNFYLTLLGSIDLNEGFYFSLSDFAFKAHMEDKNVETYINVYKITVRLDDEGYFVGKGEADERMVESFGTTTEEIESALQIVFANQKVYMFTARDSIDYESEAGSKTYNVMHQDKVISPEIREKILEVMDDVKQGELYNLFNNIKNTKDSPLNGAIAKAVEYLFTKTPANGGFEFVLNVDHLREMVTVLSTENGKTVFEKVFGEGSFASTINWIKALPNKKIVEVKAELVSWLEKAGISEEGLYQAINDVIATIKPGMGPIDFSQIVSALSSSTVADVLGEHVDIEDILQSVDMIAEMFANPDMPFISLLMQFVGGAMPAQSTSGIAMILQNIGEMAETLFDLLKNDVKIAFTTTSRGELLGAAVSIKETNLELPIYECSVDVCGKLEVVLGGDYNGDYSQMVKYVEGHLANLKFSGQKTVIDDFRTTHIVENNDKGQLIIRPVFTLQSMSKEELFNMEDKGEATYNGVKCHKYYVGVPYREAFVWDGGMYIYEDCVPCVRYRLTGNRFRFTYNLYVTEEGIVGYEIVDKVVSYSTSFSLYYNSVTKEFSGKTRHNYMLVAEHIPTKCEEEGYRTYRCTNCGNCYTNHLYMGHEEVSTTYELVNKAKGCAGGVLEKTVCVLCGKVLETNQLDGIDEDGNHKIFYSRIYVSGPKCGPVQINVEGCACGAVVEYVWVHGECEFDTYSDSKHCQINDKTGLCSHGYEYHVIVTVRCAVSNCGYTYTREEYRTPAVNCSVEEGIIYKIAGKTYKMSNSFVRHGNLTDRDVVSGSRLTRTSVCSICGKTAVETVFQIINVEGREHLRLISERDYDNNYSEVRTYNGCLYTATITRDGHSYETYGDDHVEKQNWISHESCTQYGVLKNICLLCGNQEETTISPSGHHFSFYGEDDFGYPCYACTRCGTKTYNPANGAVVLEDMGATENILAVGYSNMFHRDLEVRMVVYLNEEGTEFAELPLPIVKQPTYNDSGMLLVNLEELMECFDALWESGAVTTKYVMFVLEVATTKVNHNNKEDYYPDFMEYTLSFSLEEIASILLLP